jgi:Tfp pilus assembly protein PilV
MMLIALLLVSLGLLGLAKFQGSLLNTSGSNKARAEAIGLAQQEIEQLRYQASDTADFKAFILVDQDKSFPGTNANFGIDVEFVPNLPAPNTTYVNIVVDVAWTDATGTVDNVTLMSEIALQDILKSAFNTNASAAAMAVPSPSPRQSASEDVKSASQNVNDPNVISPTATPLPARGTVIADGSRASGLAKTFSVVNMTLFLVGKSNTTNPTCFL